MLLITRLNSCKHLTSFRPSIKLHRSILYTVPLTVTSTSTAPTNTTTTTTNLTLTQRMTQQLLRQRNITPSTAAPAASSSIASKPSGTTSHVDEAREEASALLAAIRGGTDRGSRITLIGLASNLALTGVKGTAGVILGSAALLADAFHSGSDLLADIVTLATFRVSRQASDLNYPYGYGKYESLGSLLVSFLLIGTALGIGFHSYHLLLTTLPSLNIDLSWLTAIGQIIPQGEDVMEEIADARAMWFAGASVLIKEYLYRITLKVAKEEHSNVLLANALHHRSDAFSSLVVLGAISGAWLGYPILDPIGGLLVTAAILHNGYEVGVASLKELVDRTADPLLPPKIHSLLLALRDPSLPPLPSFTAPSSSSSSSSSESSPESCTFSEELHPSLPLLSIPSIRVFASGPSLVIDLEIVLPKKMSLEEVGRVESVIKKAIGEEMGVGRVREVRIVFKGQ